MGLVMKSCCAYTWCLVLVGCASPSILVPGQHSATKKKDHSDAVGDLLVGRSDKNSGEAAAEAPVISRYAIENQSNRAPSRESLDVNQVLLRLEPLRQKSPEKFAIVENLLHQAPSGPVDIRTQTLALALHLLDEVREPGQEVENTKVPHHLWPEIGSGINSVALAESPVSDRQTRVISNTRSTLDSTGETPKKEKGGRDSIAGLDPDAVVVPNEPRNISVVPASRSWQDSLTEAIKLLEDELASQTLTGPERSQREILLRCMYVGTDRDKDAVRSIENLEEPRQEFWKNFLHAFMTEYDRNGMHASSRRAALALRPLRQAVENLAEVSPLDVRNLTFCSAVESFGKFTEFSRAEFKPNQEVLLYVEVENFVAEQRGSKYETELIGSYEIRNSQGERVVEASLPTDKQDSLNRRRDYFIAYRIFMPAEIKSGEYSLQFTMEDAKGKKSSQGSLSFRIRT